MMLSVLDYLLSLIHFGQDSAGGSGNGVPQFYGAEAVNEVVYSDNVETTHVQGVPLVNNSWGGDSAIGGRGAPQWYGSAEAPESVAVQEVPSRSITTHTSSLML